MSKLIGALVGVVFGAVGSLIGGPLGAKIGFAIGSLVGSALAPTPKGREREASAVSLQMGEYPRTAVFGRAAVSGSLVDAFNYGGTYGTDWEVAVIALADHRCDALEGFYVNDSYVAFAADGDVAGYNGQLKVWWRPGTEAQALPDVVSINGPGWTANDNGAGVCYVVVAYKADPADSKAPIWTSGRPKFVWVLRGARCYDPRLDGTVAGGAGAHRRDNPATWAWSENPIVCRYNWARGIFACDRVTQPAQLLVGRGLSATEAPPANLAWRANLCDEPVGGAARYRVGGSVTANDAHLNVEEDFAAACAGTIIQPEGAVEIDPGEARAPVAHFTDADLIVGSKVRWQAFLGTGDAGWINTVVPGYIEPSLKWSSHAAPVRREVVDVIADGRPRELSLKLGMVTQAAQAGRIGEIHRRLGRLPGRGQVTLPPRFCGIEEGDWVTWQSDRYFDGATLTLRVDAYGSDPGWRHQLTLRQISASAYTDTAPLESGSVAVLQPPRAAIAAPGPGSWTLTADYLDDSAILSPALIVTGASDNTDARFVRTEYVQQTDAPGLATVWSDAGVTGPDVVRREIAGAPGGSYYVGVSYLVDGVQGPRLVLGPVVLGSAAPATNRDPVPPLIMPEGALWLDAAGRPFRFGKRAWFSNGSNWTSNGAGWLGSGYAEAQDTDAANSAGWAYITGEGKPDDNADVTAQAVPRHEPNGASATFTANHLGALNAGQLPKNIQIKRFKGSADVSAAAIWVVQSQGAISSGTVTAPGGVVNIPVGAVIPLVTELEVSSLHDGVTITSKIAVTRLDATPPSTGGGGTTVSDNTLNGINGTVWAPLSDVMTVKTGAAGQIAYGGSLSMVAQAFDPEGDFGAEMRWKRGPAGGALAYVGAGVISQSILASVFFEPEVGGGTYFNANGSINVAASESGLAAATFYDVQLWGAQRAVDAIKTITFGGAVSATGS